MKICVYAITKNEGKHVDRWVNSMKEADGIFVLDTGSTDDTVEKLKRYEKVTVKSQKITPWRFDVARNLSLEMVPIDADVCVCTDLDEVFCEGWREKLERCWTNDTTQATYRYVWNFNDDGSEDYVFNIEKIHRRKGFKWIYPVHEVIVQTDEKTSVKQLIDGLCLYHHADITKPRSSYLPLLELSIKENPNDDRNMHYLGREYFFHGDYVKAIRTLIIHLKMQNATWIDERCSSMRYIAKCYLKLNNLHEAKRWLLRAIAEAPHLREPYIDLAEVEYSQKNWQNLVSILEGALRISQRPLTYISESKAWGYLPHDLISIAYFNLGQFELSLSHANLALKLSNNSSRIANNVEIIQKSLYKSINR